MNLGVWRDKLENMISEKEHNGKMVYHYDVPSVINEMKSDYDRSAIDMLLPYWGCYIYCDLETNEYFSDIPKPVFPMFVRKIVEILDKCAEEKMAAQGTQSFMVKAITDWDHVGCQMH